ncbi:MAG: putative lipid II flippase FtsW [Rhodanobacteraceae bacterium]|nr:putative lipid II flippase FtsW [Rhodanobacteraceae bacterium]
MAAVLQARKLPAAPKVALDPWLAVSALALASIGVVMVSSSSIAIAEEMHVGPFYFLTKHLIFLVLGSSLGWIAYRVDLEWLKQYSQVMILGGFVLLLLVFLPGIGVTVKGARRWINLGLANFQAVEAVKLFLIVYLAGYFVRHQETLQHSLLGVIKPLVVAGALIGLLLAQPDFGGALLLMAIAGGMVWLAGGSARHLMGILLIAVPVMVLAALAEPYRMRRLFSFMDPWADPFDGGFQLTQALIAVGRGEWFGVGLGESVQKLFYLPEAHTDFILAVIAEELGFVGILVIIALFAVFTGRAFQLGIEGLRQGRAFEAYLGYGIALWFAMQAAISIGVNIGALPTKGLTLPLISSGGSSVIMSCVAVGLLLKVSAALREPRTLGPGEGVGGVVR